jgi:hypothetical protein
MAGSVDYPCPFEIWLIVAQAQRVLCWGRSHWTFPEAFGANGPDDGISTGVYRTDLTIMSNLSTNSSTLSSG